MEQNARAAEVVRFGIFEVDLQSGELHKSGRKIRLQDQPFQVLVMLLQRSGGVVTHDELRQKLWPGGTFVDFDHGIRAAINKTREALGDDADNPRFVETLPRRGYRFIYPVEAHGSTPAVAPVSPPAAVAAPPRIQSIAVLPLENLSGDKDQEYFADGMTDALITNLGKIGALRVVSRQSVMRYRGSKKPLPEIARELNVDALVEGTVQRSGDRVRITANLLHAPTDRHLWADSYESEMQDVLVLQGEVARAIAEQVRVAVTPQEQVRLASARPVNPEAYEAYLKGSYALKRSAGRPVTGIEYFRQAISKDPSYSQPYVGLGLAYVQMSFGHGPLPPREAFAQIEEAALDALKLDATLAEAYSCLAWVKAFGEWDWPGGESGFRRAIELSPSSVDAHRLYSWYLSAMGRHEEAIAESQRARELDPVSPAVSYALAAAYWWARQYERCAAESEKIEQMDPTFPGARHIRAAVYLEMGSYEEAARRFQRAIALSGEDPPTWHLAHLGCAYGRAGKRTEARKMLDELQSMSKHKYVSPYLFAILQTSLSNKNQAFEWLEKSYAERNPMLAFLRVDPLFDPLRSDPRFQDLLRRMNFPP